MYGFQLSMLLKMMKTKIMFLLFALGCFANVATQPLKIYIVYTFKYNDKVVEKFYLKKSNAEKYCEMFKENHDYKVEEVTITE